MFCLFLISQLVASGLIDLSRTMHVVAVILALGFVAGAAARGERQNERERTDNLETHRIMTPYSDVGVSFGDATGADVARNCPSARTVVQRFTEAVVYAVRKLVRSV